VLLLNLNNRSGVAINVRVEMKSSATLLSFDSVSRMHGLVEIRVLRLYLMWIVDFIFNNQNLERVLLEVYKTSSLYFILVELVNN
jgi:hypothetical protein